MRSFQSIPYALIGGFVLCVFAAFLWAVVAVGSGYQTGFMAIVVGVIVGAGVRYFGAGFDSIFSVIGGSYALCLLVSFPMPLAAAAGFDGVGAAAACVDNAAATGFGAGAGVCAAENRSLPSSMNL